MAPPTEPWQDKLETEFCEAEGYHRLLDQQVVKLETQVAGHDGAAESAECKSVLDTSRALVDTIRQCLDMMQEVKTQLKSLEHGKKPPLEAQTSDQSQQTTAETSTAATQSSQQADQHRPSAPTVDGSTSSATANDLRKADSSSVAASHGELLAKLVTVHCASVLE